MIKGDFCSQVTGYFILGESPLFWKGFQSEIHKGEMSQQFHSWADTAGNEDIKCLCSFKFHQ